ncbi:DUF3489 domain-containing protein [Mesorhizobium sp. KR9-304]|uniref:DUF3489 domain-containing protein n=1 Tax=Mesorhizobium sp. KR9-304 TaxID=3156614 RepID=UPI0032B50ACA
MANKHSNTQVADNVVAVEENGARQAVPAKPRGARTSAIRKLEPIERKTNTATAAQHRKPASKTVTSKNTKAELIVKKLRTAKGASLEMLIAETGWQAHSVRGFLSAVVKKKMALDLASESGKDGVRRYRIVSDAQSA